MGKYLVLLCGAIAIVAAVINCIHHTNVGANLAFIFRTVFFIGVIIELLLRF